MMLGYSIVEEKKDGDWVYTEYSDGTHQWQYKGNNRYFAEIVVRAKSRRKKWAVVDRGEDSPKGGGGLYPPTVVGNFADEVGAKAALKFIVETNQPSKE